MTRCIVLLDGEHHPPVLRAALVRAHELGYEIAGVVFAGGYEKLAGKLDLDGVPIVHAARPAAWPEQRRALEEGIRAFAPSVVLDVSDAPVVDEQRRMRLAAIALAHGVGYRGADFTIEPPVRTSACDFPSVRIIGSAKRAGKTSVGAYFARTLAARGITPVVVAMGRGGPPQPVLVRGDQVRPDLRTLLEVSALGGHAASDYYEDALLAGVATVGARRAGAGLTGAPFTDNVEEAVRIANGLHPDVIVLEGSGTAIPSVRADATVLVLRAGDDPGLGFTLYRILLADLVVVTMAEEPTVSPRDLSATLTSLNELAGDVAYVRTVFRPQPVEPVRGKTIFYATTAPEAVKENLVHHLETNHGARVAGITHNLSDREALLRDLDAADGSYEVLVTELKAAAIDTAAARAAREGVHVVFADNVPVAIDGDLDAQLVSLAGDARARFETHAVAKP